MLALLNYSPTQNFLITCLAAIRDMLKPLLRKV